MTEAWPSSERAGPAREDERMAALAPSTTDVKAHARARGRARYDTERTRPRGADIPPDQVRSTASPHEVARADDLAGQILGLEEPWARRFCEYLATRVAFDGHAPGTTLPSRAQLADWLLDHSLQRLAIALLEGWVR